MKRLPQYLMILASALTIVFLLAAGLHAAQNFYQTHNLVSDGFVAADHMDPNLVNAWGIVFNPNAVVWVVSNGAGVSTLYDGLGVPQTLVVTIPTPPGSPGPSAPTGIVFNSSSNFVVTKGTVSGSALFIFSTEDGTISAGRRVSMQQMLS